MPEESPPPNTRLARLWKASESRDVPLRTILATVAVVVAVYLAGKVVYRLRDVLLLLLVSGFVALLLNPLVVALQRRFVPRRGLAVTIVTAWGVIVFAGLAVAFGYPLINGITHLADRLPDYVANAQHGRGWIGHLVRRYHIQTWVQQNAPKLVSFGQALGKPALAVGKGAATLLVALATIFVLVLLLLLEGPKLRAGLLSLMPADRAARISKVASEVNRSVAGYMLGNFLTSVIAGLVVFITLFALGVPFAFLWALWVALVDFLPLVGGALAGIPTVLFATGQSLTAGIITLVVFLIYTQVENHMLNPLVMSKTVRISPLLVLVSVLVGASLGSWLGGLAGGFVAALLAIPAAGALQVVVREVWHATAAPVPAAAPSGTAAPGVPGAGVTEPSVIEPGVTEPGVTEAGVTAPVPAEPGGVEPGVGESGVTERGPAEPGGVEPGPAGAGAGQKRADRMRRQTPGD